MLFGNRWQGRLLIAQGRISVNLSRCWSFSNSGQRLVSLGGTRILVEVARPTVVVSDAPQVVVSVVGITRFRVAVGSRAADQVPATV